MEETPALVISRDEIAEFNRTAVFHPESGDDTHPCLEVAGVLVFAYVDQDGIVRVSVHLDSAEPAVIDSGGLVPIRIIIEDTTVYDSEYGTERRS
ncbi:hypothetical protein [Nocardia brasiliensis]|uniref:hypothetical protein n=1 Tax=Nocardia brasiliensis TaxID=37326 RepID=UPI002458F4FB|nr:hypothetical protein [Nocardia brasiliensis]